MSPFLGLLGVVLAAANPPLLTPEPVMRSALDCPQRMVHSWHDPVLLVHGIVSTDQESWGWGLQPRLQLDGFDVCTVRLPDRSLNDIQVSSEFVVFAVREMHQRSGRKVSVVAHSEGGIQTRWAMKYWQEMRDDVGEVVTLASPHHGAFVAWALAPLPGACMACLQQRPDSSFMRALNDGDETPGTAEVTSIYTLTDDVVQPEMVNPTSRLEGATNIVLQDVCPGRFVSHAGVLGDAVALQLVVDALTHAGGANPARLPADICQRWPWEADVLYPLTSNLLLSSLTTVPRWRPAFREPALAAYVGR